MASLLRLKKLPEKLKRTENKHKEDKGPKLHTVTKEEKPIFPKGWAEGVATPLAINGLARALWEPPLALPLQLDASTNGRHKQNTTSMKGACRRQ